MKPESRNRAMEYRVLGRTGIRVSRVGLGTGGRSALGRRTGAAEAEARRIVHKALELGINLFDTSPAYEDTEAILGRALRDTKLADDVFISTKVIPYQERIDPEKPLIVDTDPDRVVNSVDRSLKLLGVEALDLVILHAVGPAYFETVIDALFPVLDRLRGEGKVRFLGISEAAVIDTQQTMLSQALERDLFDVVMLRYNVCHQGARRRVFSKAAKKAVGVMGMSPIDLSDPLKLRNWIEGLKEAGKLGPQALSEKDPLNEWSEEGAEALASAFIKFAASSEAIDVVITGTSNVGHLEANVQAGLAPPLPSSVESTLRNIYGRLDEGRPLY